MRRLLFFVASVAALLVAPSAALATGKPGIVTPAPVSASNAPAPVTVSLTWTSVGALITYHVFRATISPGATCPLTHTGADISGGLLDTLAFDDAVSAQAIYCYWVQADDGLATADSDPVKFTYDTTAPGVPNVTKTGGDGCSVFTLVSATASDNLGPTTVTTDGPFPYSPPGTAPFEAVSVTVTATDAAGNPRSAVVSGNLIDPTRPPAPVLEVSTDPAQLKATLSWNNSAPDDGAPIQEYRLRAKGPQGLVTSNVPHTTGSVAVQNLQVDATYEFTLDAHDVCGFGTASVRLVRLNDTTPPSLPLVAAPAFDPTSHMVRLSWIPSSDNIQIDHYVILRDGVSIGTTDTTDFTDPTPGEHAQLTYVVRAVDTNGNQADSAPATANTPDWTPPTAPQLTLDPPKGTAVTLHWSAARDNVGVVAYDVLRDGKVIETMTAAVRTYKDFNVPLHSHTWQVSARDAAGHSAISVGQSLTITKPFSRARVVALKMAGALRGGAARYTLAGPARLLLDVRITGTLPKAVLRVFVQSGRGRITVWRGTPGSSATRERLHSSLARHGYVTIHLGRTLHAGRTRLVLIASRRMVIVGSGKHKPSMRAG